MKVEVDEALLIYAFRYALGRASYAVGDVAEALIQHAGALRPADRDLIVREIDDARQALWPSPVGMQMDHDRWMRVREEMERYGL